MHSISSLVAAAILAFTASASPTVEHKTSLVPRQGGFVPNPGCENFAGMNINRDNFATLQRVFREGFATDGGGSLEYLGGPWDTMAVCCSGQCFSIANRAGRAVSWTGADFQAAVDSIYGVWDDDAQICLAPIAGDEYLVMTYNDGSNNSGGTRDIDRYGDTCAGAPPFRGAF